MKTSSAIFFCLFAVAIATSTYSDEYDLEPAKGQGEAFLNAGPGKCVTLSGRHPKFKYFHRAGKARCVAYCARNRKCHGYSVNKNGNCLNWLQGSLKAGGPRAAWGGATCVLKPSAFYKAGPGRCVTSSGGRPLYKYFHRVGAARCAAFCAHNRQCHGFSVNRFGNCLNFLQGSLKAGGSRQAWGGASCVLKKKDPSAFHKAGQGKCVTSSGRHPKFKYYHSVGKARCAAYCARNRECHGFSANKYGNCMNWLQGSLKAGGSRQAWGGASCVLKKMKPSAFHNAGPGKCVTSSGRQPKFKYLHRAGKARCETFCERNPECQGFSVNRFRNCMNWLQGSLKAGGRRAAWGGATCVLKKKPSGL